MSLVETVTAGMKDAMRAKDKPRLKALRNIRAAFLEAMKSDGRDSLPDDEALSILKSLAKKRRESIELYTQGGREDMAADEQAELDVIDAFLPAVADEAQTKAWVDEAIAKTGASGPSDMGKVMGVLMGAHKDELDGALASKLVKAALIG